MTFLGTMPGRPVVALDVDGNIAQYHQHFLKFASAYVGRRLEANWNPIFDGEFNEALDLQKEVYREIKLAYRQGGMKRSIPLFPHAQELVDAIHEAGAEVWFCTTRPWMRLDNIDPDTREFFDRNCLDYNGLIYGENKYQDLVDIVGADRIVCVLDDEPINIEKAEALGLDALLRWQPHNEHLLLPPFCERRGWRGVPDLVTAEAEIIAKINTWKEAHSTQDDRGEFGMPGLGFAPGTILQLPPTDVSIETLSAAVGETGQQMRVRHIFQGALTLYLQKSTGYGDTAQALGAKGQFADMNRKWGKLKQMLWDETLPMFPDAPNEDIFQILFDFMGHAALTYDFIMQDMGTKENTEA